MPRYSRIPAILRTKSRRNPDVVYPGSPRLWNAKRRIKVSRGLMFNEYEAYKADPSSTTWRELVSEDVVNFVDVNTSDAAENPQHAAVRDHKLLPEEVGSLLRRPSQFFSRPENVPPLQRKQVYFPKFEVAMIRRPDLSPFYATFQVPLWFNKLDMKSYLKSAYDVDVVHVRSYIRQFGVANRPSYTKKSVGKWFRPQSEKRMKVQLVDAFEWPKEITDFTDFEKEEYWRSSKAALDQNRRDSEIAMFKPKKDHRRSIAEQARDLLQGKTTWQPTWQQIPADARVMQGITDGPQSSEEVRESPMSTREALEQPRL